MSHDEMCMAGYIRPDLLTTVCICPTLRHVRHAEYERGREDAAKAVAYVPRHSVMAHLMNADRAIAAARGDGEQA